MRDVVIGMAKARLLSTSMWKSAFQTVIVGGLAATVAFIAAKLVS